MSLSRQSTYDEVRTRFGRNGQYLNESSVLSSSYSLSNAGGFRDIKHRNCCHRCWAWAKDGFTIISTCFATLTIAITIALAFQLRFGRPQISPQGAVASDDGGCSTSAGLAALRQRGSAVDAAIATLLCCSVTHPHLLGIGGGGVMLIHDHLQMQTRIIDFLPSIPAAHDPRRRTSDIGGGSVGVPGFLQGLKYAHELYGKLPWSKLFEPAVNAARHGFTVSASLEAALSTLDTARIPSPPALFETPSSPPQAGGASFTNAFSSMFLPFGVKLKQGTKVFRRPYAELLEKVALYGPKAVVDLDYSVEVVKLLRESGSSVSVAELQGYQVTEREAIEATYRNHTVYTAPAPFGGAPLLAALRLLDNTGIKAGASTPAPRLYHHMVQALADTRPAFYRMASEPHRRHYLSERLLNISEHLSLHDLHDEDVLPAPIEPLPTPSHLDGADPSNATDGGPSSPSPEELRRLAQKSVAALRELNDGLAEGHLPSLPAQAATQVSVIDTYDLYVSAVTGLGSLFGSQLMTPHGVLFNNMLANVPPAAGDGAGALQDGEEDAAAMGSGAAARPLVSYAPFVVVDKHLVCGWRVVSSSSSVSDSLQVLTHHLLRQMPITAAVAQPRIAVDDATGALLLDDLANGLRLPGSVRNHLTAQGYKLAIHRPPYSSVNSVAKHRDLLTSHSDTRGGGLAARLGGGGEEQQGSSASPATAQDWGESEAQVQGVESSSGAEDETVRARSEGIDAKGGGLKNTTSVKKDSAGGGDTGDDYDDGRGDDGDKGDAGNIDDAGNKGDADNKGDTGNTGDAGNTGGTHLETDEGESHKEDLHYPEDPKNIAFEATVTGVTKPKSKEPTTRPSQGNKKFMGDAVHFNPLDNVNDGGTVGSGHVVKGDLRGGPGQTKKPNSGGEIGRFVNGGRGSDVGVFTPQDNLGSFHPGEVLAPGNPSLPGNGNVGVSRDVTDSVFSDYDPMRHFSQVRIDDEDDYSVGEGSVHPPEDAQYVEAPINIWGHEQPQILPHHHHHPHDQGQRGIVLPPHVVEQLHKQFQQHQQQRLPPQQVHPQQGPYFQQQHPFIPPQQQSAIPLQSGGGVGPPLVYANAPNSGVPVVFQNQHGHQHPVLGGDVAARYSNVAG